MPELVLTPDLPEFLPLAATRRVVSVHARLLADDLTAVGLYHQLCGRRDNTFLLESADNGMWSRWSFVGVNAVATLSEHGGEAVWSGRPIVGLPTGGDPLQVLAETLATPAHATRTEVAAAADLGHGRLPGLRRRPPARGAARRQPRRPAAARTGDDAGQRHGDHRPPHRRGLAGRQRDQLRRLTRAGRAGLERCPRPRARHGRDAEQAGGTAARGARRRGRGSRRAAPEYARAVHGRRRGRGRRDQGRRGLSDRAQPTLRPGHRRRPARRLPAVAPHQPQPVPVPVAAARTRGGGLQPRGAGHRAERTGRDPSDRRLPSPRADRRRRRGAWKPNCSPTPRSGPST